MRSPAVFVQKNIFFVALALLLSGLPNSSSFSTRVPSFLSSGRAVALPHRLSTCPRLRTQGMSMKDESAGGSDAFNNAGNSQNIFNLLNNNLLFPAATDHQDIWTAKSEEKEKKDDVIDIPINGESVPIANIRPQMGMIFTCNVCETRQMRQFSKLAYEKGIVIVKCKGCDKRHLIADNLGWYKDWLGKGNSNIEELMESRGLKAQRLQGQAATTMWQEWYEPPEGQNQN